MSRTALGCHIYAGGHSLGVMQAGFDVVGHLEEGKFGTLTAKHNLPRYSPKRSGGAGPGALDVRIGLDKWNASHFEGVDWLYGNPPCASWSVAGYKVKDKEKRNERRYAQDDRTSCTMRLFDLIDEVKPLVFSWESVAVATTQGADFVRGRIRYCHKRGYDVHGIVFDGADIGLPTHRPRFFFLASKLRFEPGAVPYTRTTVRQALVNLDPGPITPVTKETKKLLRIMQQKRFANYARLADVAEEINFPRRYGFLEKRMRWDEPGFVITGSACKYHPDELRLLTVRETQVLAGYPADYEFIGAVSSQYAQIAKAVLPPCGEWLARAVKRAVDQGKRVGRERQVHWHNFIRRGQRYATEAP